MVEFTQREKMLVHAMNIMNNPAFAQAPFDLKTRALQSQLMLCGYKWNENEMIDLMNGIGEETRVASSGALKLLDKYKISLKDLKGFQF